MTRRVVLTLLERERVMSGLHELGYDVPSSHTNFPWLPLREASCDFAEFCLGCGVAVRVLPGRASGSASAWPPRTSHFLALAADWAAARPAARR
ncbi:hypothetical protein [Streptacidiphilus carbonis]|uniref:hypothetical protein n=1 Tax=Streptacidiphilus carbonis TaxID=105422 RepID=UPI0006944A92|nr:hypothetical protein [Streptacidiphilus carbonis]